MAGNIESAFQTVNRADFIPDEVKHEVAYDAPIPIGFGQTNSQPSTVRMMLEWLEPQPGDKVLDVGSGSGWTTALLAHIVSQTGSVYAVEKIPELLEFGRANCKKLGIKNTRFFAAGEVFGLPEHAPYDRILVSADAAEPPASLIGQLKPGGKLVIPVQGTILEIAKLPGDELNISQHSGFSFVPLV